jgi:hypothetical protein
VEITRLRQATKEDIGQIASLHALSWRDAYRSILDPAFLAGPVESDRMAVWAARLSNPRNDQHVVVAVEQGVLVGFVCVFGDEDPKWGGAYRQSACHPLGPRPWHRRDASKVSGIMGCG